MDALRVERALISVSDKTGLLEFAQALSQAGVEILSTGGTAKHLQQAGIPVVDVSTYTGFPEMLDGRVKTLHPKIFAGLLFRRNRPDDLEAIKSQGAGPIDLVVVNLYPFAKTIAKADVAFEEAIENIDIGGPSLLRAAAKNHEFTSVACDPAQYPEIAEQIKQGGTTLGLRRKLAAAAYAHTAQYDAGISAWFERQTSPEITSTAPPTLNLRYERRETLRYGENPHQSAAFYVPSGEAPRGWAAAKQLNGKELSYNNLLDLDAAWAMVRDFDAPSCVIIKHNNPCGAASRDSLEEAFRKAYDGDPVSAFGSVLAFNRPVDEATAEALAEPGRFVEAIAAPEFTPGALLVLTTKPKWKANVRLLAAGPADRRPNGREMRCLEGGLLVQDVDAAADPESEWKVVTQASPNEAQLDDLRFAWSIVRHVKSNAIVIVKDRTILGVGAGQMSRVDSTRIALEKAGEHAKGAVIGSDAFFPFPDSIEFAASQGVVAAIQPGGSKADEKVIESCNARKIAMVFTGRRHFKH